jgi:uncharacterized membrane protein YidH (DUF202 family)
VPAYRPDPDDPAAGLAPERTELAWDRSGLAVLVAAAVLGRRVWPLDSTTRQLGAAAIVVGIALWSTALLFTSHRAASAPRAPEHEFRRMLAATLTFAVAGFASACSLRRRSETARFPPGAGPGRLRASARRTGRRRRDVP